MGAGSGSGPIVDATQRGGWGRTPGTPEARPASPPGKNFPATAPESPSLPAAAPGSCLDVDSPRAGPAPSLLAAGGGGRPTGRVVDEGGTREAAL